MKDTPMSQSNQKTIVSPVVSLVLDRFLTLLNADKAIENSAACRIDELLRTGKVPNSDTIDRAITLSEPDKS